MRNIQTDFVKTCRPVDNLLNQFRFELPGACNLAQQVFRRPCNAARLILVDVITCRHRLDTALARILMLQASQVVIEKAFSQGSVRHFELINPQDLHQLNQDRQSAGPNLRPALGQAVQRQLTNIVEFQHSLN